MSEVIKYQIGIDAQAAIKAIQELVNGLANLNQQLNNADKGINKAEREVAKMGQKLQQIQKDVTGVNTEIGKTAKTTEQAATEAEKLEKGFSGLANTRYALYDVARTMGVISAATLGTSLAIVKVGSDFETMFAAVQRTSQTAGKEFQNLRTELIDISTEIPATVDDIARVATIAGQLGIASEDIAEFTRTIMMFSASSTVGVEAASESIGRVAQLAKVGADEYQNLAAAIYQVGITSVSTEDQILKTAENIAAIAEQSGFAAEDTIALASALASLAIRPENARGSLQRTFNIIEAAVRGGGESLVEFGRIADMTGEQFQQAWTSDAGSAFYQFIEGLSEASERGEDLNAVLSEVGIVGVRNTDALRRLAGNTEVYAKAIEESNTAFEEGTALIDGYAITADTLGAKLQTLRDTIRAIIDAISNNSAIKLAVDGIQAFADVILTIARSPFGAVLGAAFVTINAIVGVLAAAVATGTLFVASIYAMTTASKFLVDQQGQGIRVFTLLNTVIKQYLINVKGMTAAQAEAAVSAGGLRGALNGVAVGSTVAAGALRAFKVALAGTGIGLLLVGLGELYNLLTRTSDPLKDFSSDLTGFREALSKDTAAAIDGSAESLRDFYINVDSGGNILTDAETKALNFTDAMNNIGKSVDEATKSVTSHRVAVGELSREWLRNNLLENLGEDADEVGRQLAILEPYFEQLGLSLNEVFDKVIAGEDIDLNPIRSEIETTISSLQTEFSIAEEAYLKLVNAARAESVAGNLLEDSPQLAAQLALAADEYNRVKTELNNAVIAQNALNDSANFFARITENLGDLVVKAFNYDTLDRFLGIADEGTGEAGEGFEELSDAIKETIDELFNVENAVSALRNNLFGLGETLAENGLSFDQSTAAGRENYDQLMQTIELLRTQAGGDGDIFAASLHNLLNMLEGLGVASHELVAFRQLVAATGSVDITGLANAAGQAGTALLDGFDKGTQAINRTRRAASSARKEVRTLSDYISDLSRIMRDAFDFRFGYMQSIDDTAEAFRRIEKTMDDAAKKVRDVRTEMQDLRATLSGLAADRDILEYQLMVALEYGDTLRANDIRAEIEKNEADSEETRNKLSDATKELTELEEFLLKNLEDNTEAGADHRKMLLDLLEAYQDQIIAYANTGASQEQVRRYAQKLQKEFENQARQLGYSETQVKKFSAAFNDLETIIRKTPRNLTMEVNVNPALRALDEYNAKLNATRKNAGSGGFAPSVNSGAFGKMTAQMKMLTDLIYMQQQMSKATNPNHIAALYKAINDLIKKIEKSGIKLPKYADGGYVGNGGKHEPMGIVEGGEYVFTKERTAQLGVPFLNALGRSTERYYQGGPVGATVAMPNTVMVELSPYDRRLLERAGNVALFLDGREVAASVNRQNALTGIRMA